MRKTKPNSIGLTGHAWWDDWSCKRLPSGKDSTLENQLTDAGVSFERADIKHLVGMGGCAYLIFYVSPKTGKPVTTLCVPHHEIIDSWGMEYFIFEGMSKDQALKDEEWWLIAYDAAKKILDEEQKAFWKRKMEEDAKRRRPPFYSDEDYEKEQGLR